VHLCGHLRAFSEQQAQQLFGVNVVKYRANTNLEQISDWLTKILISLGLSQFGAVSHFIRSIGHGLGDALRPAPATGGMSEALGLLTATVVCGFLFFYLWSRVYLPRMFADAERSSGAD
jgi:hypothetical protein